MCSEKGGKQSYADCKADEAGCDAGQERASWICEESREELEGLLPPRCVSGRSGSMDDGFEAEA